MKGNAETWFPKWEWPTPINRQRAEEEKPPEWSSGEFLLNDCEVPSDHAVSSVPDDDLGVGGNFPSF